MVWVICQWDGAKMPAKVRVRPRNSLLPAAPDCNMERVRLSCPSPRYDALRRNGSVGRSAFSVGIGARSIPPKDAEAPHSAFPRGAWERGKGLQKAGRVAKSSP